MMDVSDQIGCTKNSWRNELCNLLGIKPSHILQTKDDTARCLCHKDWLEQFLGDKGLSASFSHLDECSTVSERECKVLVHQLPDELPVGWLMIDIFRIKKLCGDVCYVPASLLSKKTFDFYRKPNFLETVKWITDESYRHSWLLGNQVPSVLNFNIHRRKQHPKTCSSVLNYNDLVRDILARLYNCPIISSNGISHQSGKNRHCHVNWTPVYCVIETSESFLLIQKHHAYTLHDVSAFSPAVIHDSNMRTMMLVYQILKAFSALVFFGLAPGCVTLSDIGVDSTFWVQVTFRWHEWLAQHVVTHCSSETSHERTESPAFSVEDHLCLDKTLINWLVGNVSNFDYLMTLNRLAGRRWNDPHYHPIVPWVADFSRQGAEQWRDLSKSKLRLTRGDRQLDVTYESVVSADIVTRGSQSDNAAPQVPHHISELLSDITYFVYKARRLPKSLLCQHVRQRWVPGEYPASIQRLQEWSPNESIPEFFMDPEIFVSIHPDLPNLEVPPGYDSPEAFIRHHRAALESDYVSQHLHQWIDITFGYRLTGNAAVKSKNVCLPLVDSHISLHRSGVMQLFQTAHPQRLNPAIIPDPKNPPKITSWKSPSKAKLDLAVIQRAISISPNVSVLPDVTDGEDGIQTSVDDTMATRIAQKRGSTVRSLSVPRQVQLPNIVLSKDYSPLAWMTQWESLYQFRAQHCTYLGKQEPPISECEALNKEVSIVGASNETVGCILAEMALPVVNSVQYRDNRKESVLGAVRTHMSSVPRCLRDIIDKFLSTTDLSTNTIPLPEDAAWFVLWGNVPRSTIPKECHDVYRFLVNLRSTESVSRLKLSHKQVAFVSDQLPSLCTNLSPEHIEFLLPHLNCLFETSETAVLSLWHLFDPIAKILGPRQSIELFLPKLVAAFDPSVPTTKHLKLYHRTFIVQLVVRLSLQTFLQHFTTALVEAVGGYKDFFVDSHGDCTLRTNRKSHLDLSPDDSKGTALESPTYAPRKATTMQTRLPDSNVVKKDTTPPVMHQSLSYNISDVATETVVWLAHRLGPVLTARFISRNLLRMLTLCYLGRDQIEYMEHSTEKHDLAINLSQTSIVGDTTASKTLQALVDIASLYGEHFVLSQYLPHVIELVRLCRKHITETLEASLLGGITLIKSVLPILSDETLMKHIQGTIIQGILYPYIELISSLTHCFPSGSHGRRVITYRIADTIHFLSLRIGQEMSRQCLSKILKRFFMSFERAFCNGQYDRVMNLSDAQTPVHGCEDSVYQNIKHDTGSNEFYVGTPVQVSTLDEESPSAEEKTVNDRAVEEIREVFDSDMAYVTYIPFCKQIGGLYMEETLPNNELIRRLCMIDETPSKDLDFSRKVTPTRPRHLSHRRMPSSEEAGIVSGEFGRNIAVVGNRIEVQTRCKLPSRPPSEDLPSLNEDSLPQPPYDSQLLRKKILDDTRHLKGHWLSYWEHEIGLDTKQTRFDFKQIKLQTFQGHSAAIRKLLVLDNENSFMSASKDKTVRLWSLRNTGDGSTTVSSQWTYSQHKKSVFGLAFLDSQRLVGSCDSTVHIWDPFLGSTVRHLDSSRYHPVTAFTSLYAPSCCFLAATTIGSLRILDSRTGTYAHDLRTSASGATGTIRCITVAPNNKWVAVGHSSGMLSVLDLRTGLLLGTWLAHEGEIQHVKAISNTQFVSASLDQTAYVWNADTTKAEYQLKGIAEPTICMAACQSDVLIGTASNRIVCHSIEDNQQPSTAVKLRTDTFRGLLTAMGPLHLNHLLLLGSDSGWISLFC